MTAPVRSGRAHFWRLKLLAALALAALLALAVNLGEFLLGLRIRTAPVRFGAIEASFEGRAVIVRDEVLVSAPAEGRITLLAGEGRHVRTGEAVLELNADEGAVGRELAAVDRGIAEVEAAYGERRSALDRGRRELETRLEEARRELREALATGAAGAIAEAEAARSELERRLAEIVDSLRESEAERERLLRELVETREVLLGSPPAESLVLRAPLSGYLSFAHDGLESLLFPGVPIDSVIAAPTARPGRVEDGRQAAAGAPLFRIAANDRAEVVLEVRGRVPLEAGSPVRLSFRSIPERLFRGSLVEVFTVNESSWVRVALQEFDASLIHLRYDRATLLAQAVQGVIVPASAVWEVDGVTGVYLRAGESFHFRRVKLLGGDARSAVIESVDGVPVGARVVTNPEAVRKRSPGRRAG